MYLTEVQGGIAGLPSHQMGMVMGKEQSYIWRVKDYFWIFLVFNCEHGGAIGQHRVTRNRFLWRKLVFSLDKLSAKGLWKVQGGMSSRKVEIHVLRRQIRAGDCEQIRLGR